MFEELSYTWADLVEVVLWITLIWVVLYAVRMLLRHAYLFGKKQAQVARIVEILMLLIEPLTILWLLTTFVLIYPVINGLIVLLLLAGGFPHFKNYLSGRIVRFDERMKLGKKLKINGLSGVIWEKGRLGLRLKTNKGLQFVGYSNLLSDGYMLLADDEIGGFYTMKISTAEDVAEGRNHKIFLKNMMITAPYVDHLYKPEVIEMDKDYKIQVAIREKTHLKELCSLISENGYNCEVIKK